MPSEELESGVEQRDGGELEAEAQELVDTFNEAAPSYSPDLEWFGMSADYDTGSQSFVFEAPGYIDGDGLAALREAKRPVEYIEAYEFDGDVRVQIEIRMEGEDGK